MLLLLLLLRRLLLPAQHCWWYLYSALLLLFIRSSRASHHCRSISVHSGRALFFSLSFLFFLSFPPPPLLLLASRFKYSQTSANVCSQFGFLFFFFTPSPPLVINRTHKRPMHTRQKNRRAHMPRLGDTETHQLTSTMGSRQVWSAMRDSYHPCYHMMMKKKEEKKSKFEF